ncbi:MAG: hypothetical protein JKY09_06720 [Crocinitomicaceae bacterium]|nr:hypothetical protein [Crocinitomicaceae bacterium]
MTTKTTPIYDQNKRSSVLFCVNTKGEHIQIPYYALGLSAFKKSKGTVILGNINVKDNGTMGSIENTPKIGPYSGHFPRPIVSNSTKIWRYMKLKRFEELVHDNSLAFSRIDQFDDPLEGIAPDACRKAINHSSSSPEEAAKTLNLFEKRMHTNRKSGFVSCWTIKEESDMQMWDNYTKKKSDGIAIETTVGMLNESFTSMGQMPELEPIAYFDSSFFSQEIYWFPFTFKQQSFAYESELRCAMFLPTQNLDEHKWIKFPINPDLLIGKIHLSPYASDDLKKKVDDICNKHSLIKPIQEHRS